MKHKLFSLFFYTIVFLISSNFVIASKAISIASEQFYFQNENGSIRISSELSEFSADIFVNEVFQKENTPSRYRLLVKFSSEYILDADQGELIFSFYKDVSQVEKTLLKKYSFRQVMIYSKEEREIMRKGISLPPRGENTFNIFKYRGMMYLNGSEELTLEELHEIAKELEKLDFVKYTHIEPLIPPPPPGILHKSTTPDFSHIQDYREFHVYGNVYGINIEYAWDIGITGEGVRIADIEWGFNYNHEDLKRDSFIELIATTNNSYDDHGTAVAGILYAIENEYGMTGMVHDADLFYGISEITHGRVYGIARGIEHLRAGDVFVYEMQTRGQSNNYVPADFDLPVWNITKDASDAGIIIVAAAGNGAENLDNQYYNSYHSRGDNGSIIVGAGTRDGRNRASFSTYGSRVNLQGWGDWSVATTGYGEYYNGDPNATYTTTFAGTSSATPIVASAVVAVQSFAKSELNIILNPFQMRNLLIETGTEQGTGWGPGNVVPQPNVQAAILKLHEYEFFNVNININPSIAGTVYGIGTHIHGDEVKLKATANTGYSFINWTDAYGNIISVNSEYIFTMPNEDVSFTANFELLDYLLTVEIVPSGAGVVNGAGLYNYGNNVFLEAIANNDYEFLNWTNANNSILSSNSTYSFNMPASNVTIKAKFALKTSLSDINTNVSSIVIYPNPSLSEFNVISEFNIFNMKILNTDGKVLFNKLIDNKSTTISTETLIPGLYIIQINTAKGTFFKKISVQKYP